MRAGGAIAVAPGIGITHGLVDGGQRTELIPLFILASGALLGMPHASARLSLRLVSGGKERTRNDRNNTSAACSTGS